MWTFSLPAEFPALAGVGHAKCWLICRTLEAQVFSPQPPFINSVCTDALLEMSKQMERCRKSAFWVSVSFASVALHFCGSTAFLCRISCPPDMCVTELQSHREGQKSTEQLLIHCVAFCNTLCLNFKGWDNFLKFGAISWSVPGGQEETCTLIIKEMSN